MEQKTYNIYKVDEKHTLIEINRKEIDGKTYLLFVLNEAPYSTYIGELVEDKVNLLTDKVFMFKILKEICQDKETYERIKPLFV